ncbi:MAG: hypothetical protein Q9M92_06300, partial [Enterobacterales bacterium]|nr:hypothetical protein [Enterobacterales bacterium]
MKPSLQFTSFILPFATSCIFAFAAGSFAASNDLPDIGSSASQVFSLAKEQAVGDSYMRQLRAVAPIL